MEKLTYAIFYNAYGTSGYVGPGKIVSRRLDALKFETKKQAEAYKRTFEPSGHYAVVSFPIGTETTYKFRAEGLLDTMRFFLALSADKVDIVMTIRTEARMPDVKVTFNAAYSLAELQAVALKGVDLHVIAETIQYAPDYTGERKRIPYTV